VCLYVFHLNVLTDEGPRLQFAEEGAPFIIFPINSSTHEDIMEIQPERNGSWASFSCDLGKLRQSELARRLREAGEPHVHALRIPFYFNVTDPVLGAAPWLLPTHSHQHAAGAPLFTHGGVHPSPLAYLSVAL
jgi:hypothetical protein